MSEHSPTPGADPTQLRISDQDRNKVAEVLRDAAGAGRIDFDELDERLEATWAAKVYADLVPIVADLPEGAGNLPAASAGSAAPTTAAPRPPADGSLPATHHTSSVAIMSGSVRKGLWEVGDSYTAFALMGGVELDFREAVFTSRELVLNANTVMGGIDITVNAGTHVILEGIGIMGGYDQTNKVLPVLSDQSPVIRIKGLALMGGVQVIRREMPGEPKPPRLPRSQR